MEPRFSLAEEELNVVHRLASLDSVFNGLWFSDIALD
jgi:hypothetical protein